MSEIDFKKYEEWDNYKREIIFHALQRGTGEMITCRITSEILEDKFNAPLNADKNVLLETFNKNRSIIESLAERHIESKFFEPDGTIIIKNV